MPITRTYKAGSFVFHENDLSRELYIIQSGKVKVHRKVGGREIQLAVLSQGSVLGEMALIDGKPRSASAVAIEDSALVVIDAERFLSKIRGVPVWFMSLVRLSCLKIRRANDRFQLISKRNPYLGIILLLAYRFDRAKIIDTHEDGIRLSLDETQKWMIRLLGATRKRIAQALDFLERNGFITFDEGEVTLADAAKFEEYIAFLRLWLRKAFEKVETLDEQALKILDAVAAAVEIRTGEDRTIEMVGADMRKIAAECGTPEAIQEVLRKFRDLSILSLKKDGAERKSDDPLEGCTILIDSGLWKRYYLFHKFRKLVLPVC